MNHRATPRFWRRFEQLPVHVQQLARRCFDRLRQNPAHPSLRFKQVGRFWSVRIGLHHRAVAVRDDNNLAWFWIGTHTEYDQLLQRS